ncbi:MAG: RHS repeat domain-containing protein [Bacteroidota bacterium]
MKTKNLFFTLAIILWVQLQGQEKSYFAELIPPSPDVAQLGQYGATQVGKYTGTANVSIPLHSIDLEGMQIPIALSYQTGGIKVAQEASWVGLGWNLSANAVITKQTNGYDDLTNGGGAVGYLYSPSYSFGNLTQAQETALFNAYQTTPHDTEPDLFTANIFGQSVQFVLPKKGSSNEVQAIVLNDNLVKIYYYVNEDEFKVVNGQGYEFSFGGASNNGSKEFTTMYRSDGANHQTDASALAGSVAYQSADNGRTWQKHTAWHVDNVVAPSGRTINFTYQKVSYFGYPSYSESRNFMTCTNTVSGNGVGYMDFDSSTTKSVSCSITGFQAVQLTKIAGDFGEVNFNLSSREDISSRYQTSQFNHFSSVIPSGNPIERLTGITVKNNQNQTIKNISFTQSYFNSDESTDTSFYKKEKYIRLKLDEVTVNDQTYSFDYLQPNDLPAKDSKDEDFWGYYNGKGNTIRMPSFGRLTFCSTNQKEVFFNLEGANKGADFNKGKIGLLNKVTYPTKGYTDFEYEGNTVLVEKPTMVGYSNPYSNSSDLSYNYQYIKRTLVNGYSTPLSDGDTFTITSFNTLPFAYNVKVDWRISCGVESSCGNNVGVQYVYKIVKLDNPGAGTEYKRRVTSTQYGSPLEDSDEESLPNGTYRFEAPSYSPPSGSGGPGAFLTVTAEAHYLKDPEESPFPWEEFDVGGARVKTVINRDSNGNFISKKEYEYDASNYGQIVSSGKLMNQLVYHSKYGFLDYTPQNFNQLFTMSSGSSTSLDFSAQGSHVGYSYVTEYDISETGTKKGKIQTAYENQPNELLTYYVGTTPLVNFQDNNISSGALFGYDVHYGSAYLIGVPPKSFSHRNGNMLWEEIEDASFKTLKRVDNTYSDYQLTNLSVYKAYFSPANIVADYGYGQLGNKFLPTVSETRDYFGNDFTTTTVTTDYEIANYLPRSVTTNTSENNVTTKQETFYVFDLAHGLGSEPYRSTRMGLNQLTDPVLIRSYENNDLLSETKFRYGSFSGDIWRTEALEAKDGDPLTQRMDFISYDDLGNLEEYKRTDGISVSYIWGYKQMYPVAKVENATRSQIDAILGANFNTGTGGLNTTQENNLRNGLPNAMVTTYTYKPGVGMTSTTDPRGYKITYEYDTNNRLKKVKDAADEVVNEYEYHFKGQ